MKEQLTSQLLNEGDESFDVSRRHFLHLAGGLTGASILFAACSKSNDSTSSTGTVKLGAGDGGILNYAYALEQLEAAFYTSVVSNTAFLTIFSPDEQLLIRDIRDHEIAHREFFKAALGSSAIPALTPNFTTIDFTNKASILAAALSFEDLGVGAYNGAGKLISDINYLAVAGKIVSVEARHAAYLRDVQSPGSFATTADGMGLDFAKSPTEVLSIASAFVTNKIDASQLPQ